MKEKAEKLISRQINKHRQNIRRGWVQPADVARVEEKIRVLEYILEVLNNEPD